MPLAGHARRVPPADEHGNARRPCQHLRAQGRCDAHRDAGAARGEEGGELPPLGRAAEEQDGLVPHGRAAPSGPRYPRGVTMRPAMQRVLIYWALLTLGPIAIGFSLVLTNVLTQIEFGVESLLPGWVFMVIQLLVQSLMYAALYVYVPNCKVKWMDAFVGGLLVTVVGVAIKWCFSYYLSTGPLTTIYGSFVLIPVVLLWIYLSWLLVLSGAAIAATIPMLTSGRYSDMNKTGNDFITGVALLHELMLAQEKGEPSVSIHVLCKSVDSYPEAAGAILERLADVGYVGKLQDDRKYDEHWSLLVSPQTTTLGAAFDALVVDPSNSLIAKENSPLYDWYCLVTDAEWKKRPMVETLRFIHPIN